MFNALIQTQFGQTLVMMVVTGTVKELTPALAVSMILQTSRQKKCVVPVEVDLQNLCSGEWYARVPISRQQTTEAMVVIGMKDAIAVKHVETMMMQTLMRTQCAALVVEAVMFQYLVCSDLDLYSDENKLRCLSNFDSRYSR